jgi:PPK2 family polyphosphate:nucleotide phosphotransferase
MKDLRAPRGEKVKLSKLDAGDTSAFGGKKEDAEKELDKLRTDLDGMQELLYADHRHAVLIVLQGMDSAGKDGVIRHVFDGVNPQGVQVASFKTPTPEESDHDFLWRVHPHTPGKGHMAIFNRSHYEDVLVVRVHKLVPKDVWEGRYKAINAFERELTNEGTTIVKFFLHISSAEQKARLQERLDDPTKRWKLSAADVHERQFWNDYQEAYEEVLEQTNTDWAPWYLIPSDHKWFRNWVVSKVLIQTLGDLKLAYPKPSPELASLKIP